MNPIRWYLPKDLLAASFSLMEAYGAYGHEGLVLWFGRRDGDVTHITHAVEPHGPGLHASPYHLSLSIRAMAMFTDLAEQIGSPLVGQVHSHPGHFTDLTELDEEQGIRVEDYLSVVYPEYSQRQVMSVAECGVHVFERGRYRRLADQEIHRRLITMDNAVTRLRCWVPA